MDCRSETDTLEKAVTHFLSSGLHHRSETSAVCFESMRTESRMTEGFRVWKHLTLARVCSMGKICGGTSRKVSRLGAFPQRPSDLPPELIHLSRFGTTHGEHIRFERPIHLVWLVIALQAGGAGGLVKLTRCTGLVQQPAEISKWGAEAFVGGVSVSIP